MHRTHETNVSTDTTPAQETRQPFKPSRIKCHHCTDWFMKRKPWQKFCSTACRVESHKNQGILPNVLEYLDRKLPGLIQDRVDKKVAERLAELSKAEETAQQLNGTLQKTLTQVYALRHTVTQETAPQPAKSPKSKPAA